MRCHSGFHDVRCNILRTTGDISHRWPISRLHIDGCSSSLSATEWNFVAEPLPHVSFSSHSCCSNSSTPMQNVSRCITTAGQPLHRAKKKFALRHRYFFVPEIPTTPCAILLGKADMLLRKYLCDDKFNHPSTVTKHFSFSIGRLPYSVAELRETQNLPQYGHPVSIVPGTRIIHIQLTKITTTIFTITRNIYPE